MKNLILVILALGLSLPHARAGQETQNGGGAAEQNFAYAFAILKPLYTMCLASGRCVSSTRNWHVLHQISLNLDYELKTATLIRFDSSKTNPKRFYLDSQVRVAVTGDRPGSPIWINRAMIYRKVERELRPTGVSEAVGILTHELGHHNGVKDHDSLDMLAGEVRAFLDTKQDRVTLDTFADTYDEAEINLHVFHFRQNTLPAAHTSLFWLAVNDSVYDLTAEIQEQLECPSLNGEKSVVLGYRFSHMHWSDPVQAGEGDKTLVRYPLLARVWLECASVAEAGGKSRYLAVPYRAAVNFTFSPMGRKLMYRPGKVSVTIENR